ncbi:septin-12 isoform X2 [Dipodomys merriami]
MDRRDYVPCHMDTLRQSPSPCSSRPSSPRTPPFEMFGPVGIEAVLDQLKIKAMKTGFEFNIMVVGQSGLGKSTMVNTLFKSKVWKSAMPSLEVPTPQTLELHSVSHVIEEKGLKLKLTVTDTPGFGDQINNDKCWDPVLGYINQQYEQYLQEELLITRQRHIPDTRVHCCVYFVPPTGHCLRPLDIEFLRRLCRTVNVVPVIARADSLTIEEREAFRSRIQQNLKTHCIEVYPQKCFDEDINDSILNGKIREQIPFAVVGADQEHLVNGRCVLGRKTKWGIIEVENIAHCEFLLLRDLLIRSHLQDLKDITHNVHYENYRVIRLNESHQLPRGPGWVNLAPASPVQLTSPGCLKVRRRAQKDSKDDEC